MGINFDTIPTKGPGQIDGGIYKLHIVKAIMKASATPGKPDNLLLTIKAYDKEGGYVGQVQEYITESTAHIPLYKLGRMCKALGIELEGTIALKKLMKLFEDKTLYGEIYMKEETYKGNTSMKPQFKVFDSETFWSVKEIEQTENVLNEIFPVDEEATAKAAAEEDSIMKELKDDDKDY